MSRYIDAEWLKAFFEADKGKDRMTPIDSLLALIDDAPSIDIPQWIPCSERLPQYRVTVLISTFWGVRVAERDGTKEDGTDDFWYLFLDDATAHPRYVYAWMPLPKPYGEREGE